MRVSEATLKDITAILSSYEFCCRILYCMSHNRY